MTLNDAVQWTIVGGAVLFSALYALGRFVPRLRLALGNKLADPRHPRWVNALASKVGGVGGGCGSACNSCGSCDTTPKAEEKPTPVRIIP